MAKGDVRLVFDAQTAASIAEILKLRNALAESESTMKSFGEASAKAGQKAEGAGTNIVKLAQDIGLIGGAAATAGEALSTLAGIADAKFKLMEQRAENLSKRVSDVTASLAGAGQQQQAPEFQAALNQLAGRKIGGREVIPSEAFETGAAVSRTVANKVDVDVKANAVEIAQFARAAGLDQAGATQLATNFAQLSRGREKGRSLYGKSDQDIERIARMFQVAGVDLDEKKLGEIWESSDPETMIKAIAAAAKDSQRAKALVALEKNLDEEIDPVRKGELEKQFLSAKSGNPFAAMVPEAVRLEAESRLATMSAKERNEIRKARWDEDKFGPESARMLRLSQIPKNQRLSASLADPTLARPEDQRLVGMLAEDVAALQLPPTIEEEAAARFASDPKMVGALNMVDAAKAHAERAHIATTPRAIAIQARGIERKTWLELHPAENAKSDFVKKVSFGYLDPERDQALNEEANPQNIDAMLPSTPPRKTPQASSKPFVPQSGFGDGAPQSDITILLQQIANAAERNAGHLDMIGGHLNVIGSIQRDRKDTAGLGNEGRHEGLR